MSICSAEFESILEDPYKHAFERTPSRDGLVNFVRMRALRQSDPRDASEGPVTGTLVEYCGPPEQAKVWEAMEKYCKRSYGKDYGRFERRTGEGLTNFSEMRYGENCEKEIFFTLKMAVNLHCLEAQSRKCLESTGYINLYNQFVLPCWGGFLNKLALFPKSLVDHQRKKTLTTEPDVAR